MKLIYQSMTQLIYRRHSEGGLSHPLSTLEETIPMCGLRGAPAPSPISRG
jgi:hypothetical protein